MRMAPEKEPLEPSWLAQVKELLGPHKRYHRAQTEDALPSGVKVEQASRFPKEVAHFTRWKIIHIECSRWDADAMMKRAEVHVVDLVDAATIKLNPALHSHALELEAADDGLVVSNRGGFHSKPDAVQKLSDCGCEEATQIMNLVRSCVMYEPGKKPRHEKDSKVTTAWINVCRNGHTHGLHSHEPAKFSAVYYVSVPESKEEEEEEDSLSGHLVLRFGSGGNEGDPALGLEDDSWCLWDHVEPKEGRLVIFPSSMPHGVLKVSTAADEEKPRISIAFNTGEKNVNLEKYGKKNKKRKKTE